MAGILDLMGYIQDQSEKGRQAGLQRLVGKAYGAAPDQQQQILSTVAQRGAPDLAMSADKAFGEQQDNVHLQMAKRAAEVVALYQSNPQMAQQVYQNGLLPIARRAGVPNAPMQLDPSLIPGLEKLASAATIGSTAGGVQSTYIDAQGNRVAILRDGRTQVLGQNAPNNQIIDTGNGFYGVNKGNLQAAPVMIGGQQQAPRAPSGLVQTPSGPVNIDPSLPPEIRAQIAANPDAFTQGGMTQGAPVVQDGPPTQMQQQPAPQPSTLPPALDYQNGGQLRSVPKPQAAPAGYQWNADHTAQVMIPGGPAEMAAQARDAANKAKADAAALKGNAAAVRQQEAANSAQSLIDAIDRLEKHPGFKALGTFTGDMETKVPFIRNDAKDAQAQLRNIAGQVALTTMNRLKALSSQGATGFGALSAPELHLLQNSIAALDDSNISNAQLTESLRVIKDSMAKIAAWKGGAQQPAAPSGWSIQKVN
jgi:hypothetical protein